MSAEIIKLSDYRKFKHPGVDTLPLLLAAIYLAASLAMIDLFVPVGTPNRR